MATKRKLNAKSYQEKYSILTFMDENPTWKKKDVAAKFNVKTNTLSDMIKNRHKIVQAVENPSDARKGVKRMRQMTFDNVDAALITWFRQRESLPDLQLDGEMLLEKAKYFAKELGHETAPSQGWIDRFKKRHGIGHIKKAGEAAGVDEELVQGWKDGRLTDILRRYDPKDIYNADETGLFWQMLPEKSLGFQGTTYHGGKQQKTRVTVLVCANMDGSDKLPLFVIGKSKRPRAFKNVKKLPVAYESNKKAWMTGALFEAWLRKLDGKMEGRKIAMVIDNCPAHPHIKLDNIELVFLPPNTTSLTQPMDGGVIRNLKQHYRHILAFRRLAAADEGIPFKWDLLDAIIALKTAWNKVSQQTIANVYRHVGFVLPCEQVEEDGDRGEEGGVEDAQEFRGIWERLGDLFPLPAMEKYIDVDATDTGVELLTDDQIVEITGVKEDGKSDDENVFDRFLHGIL
ncbi:tigger transposable element-derived protein 4-like [Diadema antillarum]|uniref:tigger transposable element-derived protein 4-like n=1 Tax=Diadema antillarum TaxID=105358 RepID=UPI003A87111F